MKMCSCNEEGEHSKCRLSYSEPQLSQEPKANDRGQNVQEDIGGETDKDISDTWIVSVVMGEERKPP